jgi:hypothetical protein
LVVEKAAM